MKRITHIAAVALSLTVTSNSVVAGNPTLESVRQDGLLVSLDHLRDSNNDDGMLIPLSMEILNLPPQRPAANAVTATAKRNTAMIAGNQKQVRKTIEIPAQTPATSQPASPLPLPVKMVEASAGTDDADEAVSDDTFKAVVEAMKPEGPAKPLGSKRLTFYLSDEVAFAQIELSSAKEKLKNGRYHLATLYSEERDSVLHGGLTLDSSYTESFRLSFGARAYIALLSMENVDAFAAAIGAEAAYRLPFERTPLEFSASLYYAPDILTFGAGDRAVDAQLDLAMPFRERSALFAGIRFLQVDVRPEDREVDNRFHVGLRWDFD